jgi:hypothetical protein
MKGFIRGRRGETHYYPVFPLPRGTRREPPTLHPISAQGCVGGALPHLGRGTFQRPAVS